MNRAPAYRLDGAAATRDAFYAAACDPRRHIVVEACAGAGKTWMLVSRILRALLDGAEPQQILALTFTRKAAGEMRERLDQWLGEFAAMSLEQCGEQLVLRGVDRRGAAVLAPQLQSLQSRLHEAGRAVELRTFHGWFSQLLRAAPLDLLETMGLQPGFELVEDLEDLGPALFRRFHAAVLSHPSLEADYLALAERHGRHKLRQWLQAAWDKRIEIQLADGAGVLSGTVDPAQVHWPAFGAQPLAHVQAPDFVERCAALARALGASGKGKAVTAAQGLLDALARADAQSRFVALWRALFTRTNEPRKELGDLPALAALSDELVALKAAVDQQHAHDDHQALVRLARVLLAEYSALKRLRGLVDMADLESAAQVMLGDSAVSGWVQERLDARLAHVLIDEFQDTSPLQWHALHGWLSGYGGAGGGARTPSLFIVGDPKQSIYRFRRAEPLVFSAAREFVAQALGGQVLECDHTRRNAGAVLEAVNAVFGEANREGAFAGFRPHSTEVDASVSGAVLALEAVQRPPNKRAAAAAGGAAGAAAPAPAWRNSVTTPRRVPEAVLREHEARAVAVAVSALVRGESFDPGDVLVLSRKRASLRLVADALRALHLPFTEPEDNRLAEQPEVRDLVALLDVLASPGHDLSLAHALRSPLFGASDEDLLWLARRVQASREEIEDGHRRGDEIEKKQEIKRELTRELTRELARELRREGAAWWDHLLGAPKHQLSAPLARAQGLLTGWAKASRELPPHDLLDRIVHEGDLVARLAAVVPADRRADALDAVNALLTQALQLDGGRYATPYNFVRALRQRALKISVPQRKGVVQLLTIHGAKGLEARAVFVVDSEPERHKPAASTLLVDWPVELARPARVAFVATEARVPQPLAELMALEHTAREREELNGLYVAMTRARERLVFSRTPPQLGSVGRSWWQRVEPLVAVWQPASFPPDAHASSAFELAQLPKLAVLAASAASPLSWAALAIGEAAASPVDDANSRLGQAVHRGLEWATGGRTAAPRAELAAAAAAAFGVDARAVLALMSRVLDGVDGRHFFDNGQLKWHGNELAAAGEDGAVLRIDRLVQLASGQWWVLDYKIGQHPDTVAAYRAQLQQYRRCIQALEPHAEVRAAFIAGDGAVLELAPD